MTNGKYTQIAQIDVMEKYGLIKYDPCPISEEPPGAILGTWAISVPGKYRRITAPDMELARGVLPADVTRAWIRDVYDLPLRRRKEQLVTCYDAPLLARRGKWRGAAYLDIRHAYLTMLGLGYDIEYLLGKYIGVYPEKVPDEIANTKFCYAIAVAMSRNPMSQISIMGKEGIFTQHPYNVFSNPCLYNFTHDVLAAIAGEMVALLGDMVRYVNTDGYVVDLDYVDSAMKIIRSWGFDAKIKASGQTEIFGVGGWQVGNKSSKRLARQPRDYQSEYPTRSERQWLKRRVPTLLHTMGIT